MTNRELASNMGIHASPYAHVEGYRHLNVFVQFSQDEGEEPPVDLGVMFAFDADGHMAARRYVNFDENVVGPQGTNFIGISGAGAWHGPPEFVSRYIARFPVMAPYVGVFVYNRAPFERKVSVWGYLVS